MAIIYTWKVTGLKTVQVEGEPNFVFQTYWQKTGTDADGNTGTFSGATPFKQIPDEPNFIPYDQLTEEIVLGWIQDVVIPSYGAHIDEQIEKQILAKINPPSEPPLPWGEPNTQASTTV
jgi:hypothetical protein